MSWEFWKLFGENWGDINFMYPESRFRPEFKSAIKPLIIIITLECIQNIDTTSL